MKPNCYFVLYDGGTEIVQHSQASWSSCEWEVYCLLSFSVRLYLNLESQKIDIIGIF